MTRSGMGAKTLISDLPSMSPVYPNRRMMVPVSMVITSAGTTLVSSSSSVESQAGTTTARRNATMRMGVVLMQVAIEIEVFMATVV